MVLQAACLGARDSVTPLGVVLIASAVNGLGDWITVCRMGLGVFGAAAATASAETVSMLLLGAAVWKAQGERECFEVVCCTGYRDLRRWNQVCVNTRLYYGTAPAYGQNRLQKM